MTQRSSISPPIGRGGIPRLTEIDELKFEEMCCALLDVQADILGCDRFGVRGQAVRRGSIARGDPEASARRLAELLRAAVDAWPAGVAGCRAYVQQLCDRLPVAQARWLWSLLIHLRARP